MKFAVEQRTGSAVMLLQEVRNWPGGHGVLSGYEFHTDIELDTAVAIPRDFASDVTKSYRKSTFLSFCMALSGVQSIFLVMGMSPKMIYLWSVLKEMEDVVINLRRRHQTSRIVIGSDLNVSLAPSLAPSLEGLTGSRIHPIANVSLA